MVVKKKSFLKFLSFVCNKDSSRSYLMLILYCFNQPGPVSVGKSSLVLGTLILLH